jgi:4'-phosphopantetheinyl transferase
VTRPGDSIGELPGPGAIHVWHAGLEPPATRWQELAAALTRGERERAERLPAGPHRRRFVAGRGLLREILGAYLGLNPGAVPFAYGPAGKPRLAGDGPGLAFNLSHSANLAVCAVAAPGSEIGVDVERLRPLSDIAGTAACWFSPRERALLAVLDGDERVRAFFRVWTRKEAWLKATGFGLPLGPERVEVAVAPVEPARLLGVAGIADAPRRWSLRDLDLRPGFAAALAVRGPIRECACRAWPTATFSAAGARGGGSREMRGVILSLWHDAGNAATELAWLKDGRAPGGRVRAVCRTAKGTLFGYEMDGADEGVPTAESMVRLVDVKHAVAWMARQGFPAESIASSFPESAFRHAQPHPELDRRRRPPAAPAPRAKAVTPPPTPASAAAPPS